MELLHWGAGDVVPTLPEDWVVYERTFKIRSNFNFPIREVTQDVIDIERQDAGLVEDRAPTNWEQSRRGRNDGELNLFQAQDSANAHKVAQTVRGWRSHRADDGKLLIRRYMLTGSPQDSGSSATLASVLLSALETILRHTLSA